MTENTTRSTGQTSGMTGLSKQTITRYVSRYPMGFSDRARQHVKGRRFNGKDIKTLLLINKFLQARRSDEIEKILTGEVSSADVELFEVENFMALTDRFEAMKRDVEKIEKRLKLERQYIPNWEVHFRDEIFKLRDKVQDHEQRIHQQELKRNLKVNKWDVEAERLANEKANAPKDDRSLWKKFTS